MNRRDTLLALVAFTLLAATRSFAQAPKPPRRIGWLAPASAKAFNQFIDIFTVRLRELGYAEGRDFAIEARYSDGHDERLPALAHELVARGPAVIVTAGSAAIGALRKETSSIPIVFGTAFDVVEQGFVASIARPGGNITGVTLRTESFPKLVQLIRETQPAARRISLLEHTGDRFAARSAQNLRQPAEALAFQWRAVRVGGEEDFERAFAEMARDKSDALIVPQIAVFGNRARVIADLAMKNKLPMYSTGRYAAAGGLLGYASDNKENFRRAAAMVDKIFKGARPADIPIEEPDRFFLIVNLRTAKALRITIPQSVLIRADEVIE
jgi:putative tryptophan/tyrosine transport system substrate-binding protein